MRAELGGDPRSERKWGAPLTFILRTPASPWIPTEMGGHHPRLWAPPTLVVGGEMLSPCWGMGWG